MDVVVVIPARYGSSRFPGKVVAKDTGKFLVQHTAEAALKASTVDKVVIATDDQRVLQACESFDIDCVMTSESHQSGTDRIAEAVQDIDCEIVINLQADEPEMDPENIDFLVLLLKQNPEAAMATLVTGIDSKEQIADPNVVKAVVDTSGRAIYFSRSVIPYDRDAAGVGQVDNYFRHLGIYAYRREFLYKFTSMPQSKLEKIEKLEQLRAVENGYSIITGKVDTVPEGIDTPEQYRAFVERMKS